MPDSRTYTKLAHLAGRALVLALAVGSVGCGSGSGSGSDDLTATETQRRIADPKVGTFLLEGQRAYERGGYNMALAMTDSAERYAPDLADLHFLRGTIYTQLNRLGVAQAAYHTVLRLDPEYKGARYNLGLIAFRQDRLRDAINWFKEEEDLEVTSNLVLELGRVYSKLGEPDSARMAYERSIELDETNSTAFMWLGQLHEELGEMEKALEVSKAGLEIRPDDADYQYVVGSLLFRMGHVDEAESYLRPVAAERTWHHGAQFSMGQVLMRLGREDEAKLYFAQADSAQQVQQKIAEAERDIGREPIVLDHWVKMGVLLRKAGEVDKAIEAYKVATTIDPWNMHLQSNLALLFMEKGETDTAIRRYRAILTVDSTLTDVWLNLGAAHANAGHREEAKTAWERVEKLQPGHPAARAYLARISEIPDAS